ncbi:electron transporter SenC [Paramagnetospirillum marisnigri]|uniref:Electron transporter SenC n=1 Tax=Paramagnetospirillum marisnigri TaxID=1285242 RepID=A0A178MVW1_9PROT|nr:SCO family protein [Paramagnetospirillum marisnigri]OAN53177.1 electron transporter SenC [Paramagnetospirillum marisnigri]
MKFSKTLLALMGVIVVAFVVIGVRLVVWSGQSSSDGKAIPAIGGPFALTDQTGKAVSDRDFRNRYMLIFFGYTYCPDVCPTTLSTVAGALDKLGPGFAAKMVPIFITIDPERDTSEVMKTYVEAFNPAIQGLTGSPEQIAKVAKEFKVYAAKVKGDSPDSYTVDHSAILYLMGPDGRFIAHFTHGISVDDLVAGLRKHIG